MGAHPLVCLASSSRLHPGEIENRAASSESGPQIFRCHPSHAAAPAGQVSPLPAAMVGFWLICLRQAGTPRNTCSWSIQRSGRTGPFGESLLGHAILAVLAALFCPSRRESEIAAKGFTRSTRSQLYATWMINNETILHGFGLRHSLPLIGQAIRLSTLQVQYSPVVFKSHRESCPRPGPSPY